MSLELQQKQDREVISEMTRQGRCGSCGKPWDEFYNFDEILCHHINNGKFQKEEEIKALGIVREIIRKAIKWKLIL